MAAMVVPAIANDSARRLPCPSSGSVDDNARGVMEKVRASSVRLRRRRERSGGSYFADAHGNGNGGRP